MSITISCPCCNAQLRVSEDAAGKKCECPHCGQKMLIPSPQHAKTKLARVVKDADWRQAPPVRPDPEEEETVTRKRRRGEKYCHECGEPIRARAEICPHCGVRQQPPDDEDFRGPSRRGVQVPLLISAIANIVVGLLWLSTCFGVIFTIPMILLCIFEFVVWAQSDSISRSKLGHRAGIIGAFEIFVGLMNTPTLICGIINLINSSKLQRAG